MKMYSHFWPTIVALVCIAGGVALLVLHFTDPTHFNIWCSIFAWSFVLPILMPSSLTNSETNSLSRRFILVDLLWGTGMFVLAKAAIPALDLFFQEFSVGVQLLCDIVGGSVLFLVAYCLAYEIGTSKVSMPKELV